jgi:hypothetical protein
LKRYPENYSKNVLLELCENMVFISRGKTILEKGGAVEDVTRNLPGYIRPLPANLN